MVYGHGGYNTEFRVDIGRFERITSSEQLKAIEVELVPVLQEVNPRVENVMITNFILY